MSDRITLINDHGEDHGLLVFWCHDYICIRRWDDGRQQINRRPFTRTYSFDCGVDVFMQKDWSRELLMRTHHHGLLPEDIMAAERIRDDMIRYASDRLDNTEHAKRVFLSHETPCDHPQLFGCNYWGDLSYYKGIDFNHVCRKCYPRLIASGASIMDREVGLFC